MKYYDMHDEVYEKIQAKGNKTWGNVSDINKILDHEFHDYLKKDLNKYFPQINGEKVLDLGTGTGITALFLESLGFKSTGYDVSPKAIEMAKENAKELGLNSNFIAGDLTEQKFNNDFDFVTDSCCLHCIVFDEDRKNFFDAVKSALKPNGKFVIYTMTESEDMSDMTSKDHFIYKDEILWSEGPDRWDMDWHQVDGKRVFAHRRMLSNKKQAQEILDNGFKILSQEITTQDKSSDLFAAWVEVV